MFIEITSYSTGRRCMTNINTIDRIIEKDKNCTRVEFKDGTNVTSKESYEELMETMITILETGGKYNGIGKQEK